MWAVEVFPQPSFSFCQQVPYSTLSTYLTLSQLILPYLSRHEGARGFSYENPRAPFPKILLFYRNAKNRCPK